MIIKAKTIITNDEANNFYEDSAILIEGKIIKEIGDFEKIKKENPNHEIVDFSDKLVMPGLICAHSHCYSAYARGMSLAFLKSLTLSRALAGSSNLAKEKRINSSPSMG
ncbi:hypothetical protein NH288_01940 [Anaerococcus sp. NML200537]|uniref:hypothetical protein n=1 Tax=Anaerococcus sp. NML200537 TaxID=2954485 RepID=UPI0022386417|nr:hypothetical protein [Anaerococcus sp. NML200537]MCW6700850.1 hypothetical protein [Anaerococcus sp. NML200537]